MTPTPMCPACQHGCGDLPHQAVALLTGPYHPEGFGDDPVKLKAARAAAADLLAAVFQAHTPK